MASHVKAGNKNNYWFIIRERLIRVEWPMSDVPLFSSAVRFWIFINRFGFGSVLD